MAIPVCHPSLRDVHGLSWQDPLVTVGRCLLGKPSMHDGTRNGVGVFSGLPSSSRVFIPTVDGACRFWRAVFPCKVSEARSHTKHQSHTPYFKQNFVKHRAFSFGTRHKTKSKFYLKFLGEGHLLSLSLGEARKKTQSDTKSMTTEN